MFVLILRYSVLKVPIGNEAIEHLSFHYWVKIFHFKKKNSFTPFFPVADSARMIDIDHETKSAYSENLGIPGEEAALLEPNMDQIDGKLMSPNLTGIFDKISSI